MVNSLEGLGHPKLVNLRTPQWRNKTKHTRKIVFQPENPKVGGDAGQTWPPFTTPSHQGMEQNLWQLTALPNLWGKIWGRRATISQNAAIPQRTYIRPRLFSRHRQRDVYDIKTKKMLCSKVWPTNPDNDNWQVQEQDMNIWRPDTASPCSRMPDIQTTPILAGQIICLVYKALMLRSWWWQTW